jgi:hypothetical protein
MRNLKLSKNIYKFYKKRIILKYDYITSFPLELLN